jgi:DNA-binding MarR family transcriptional regulator
MKHIRPEEFRLEEHVFFWISQVLEARNRRLARELRGHDLRVPEWRALAALYARQRLSMGELSKLAAIDRTTLSRTVDRMEEAGWVTRISDAADMRITRLRLTDRGRDKFNQVWPLIESVNASAADKLPDAAMGMVSWALSEMTRNLDQLAAVPIEYGTDAAPSLPTPTRQPG